MHNRPMFENRVTVRLLTFDDAPFIIELLNDPDFLRFIGDKKVRNVEDAHRYMEQGPMMMQKKFGFGLNVVELRESGQPIGICGLVKRDYLDHPDIGFAFLASARGKGYAFEAAQMTLQQARESLQLPTLLAIANSDNHASARLLQRLGMSETGTIKAPGDDTLLRLFRVDFASV